MRTTPSDVTYHIFYEMEQDVAVRMIREYRAGSAIQPWNVAPASRLIAIWSSAARLGFVRDEQALDDIVALFIDNTLRLAINTDIAAHGALSTPEALEQLDILDGLDDLEHFVDWAISTPEGPWRISDSALTKLIPLAARLLETTADLERMAIVDAMLGVTHPRSDLASWYVEGGTKTLDRLAIIEWAATRNFSSRIAS